MYQKGRAVINRRLNAGCCLTTGKKKKAAEVTAPVKKPSLWKYSASLLEKKNLSAETTCSTSLAGTCESFFRNYLILSFSVRLSGFSLVPNVSIKINIIKSLILVVLSAARDLHVAEAVDEHVQALERDDRGLERDLRQQLPRVAVQSLLPRPLAFVEPLLANERQHGLLLRELLERSLRGTRLVMADLPIAGLAAQHVQAVFLVAFFVLKPFHELDVSSHT